VSDSPPPPERSEPIVTDLVEYLIVVAPDQEALGTVAPALVELVESDTIRILDLVLIARERDGAVTMLGADAVAGAGELARLDVTVSGMLTEHDVELAAMALRPGTAGIVLVTEDRWAGPLSAAARQAGGRIVAGDRIPPERVERVLAEQSDDDSGG
jgi:Family of unknown function (DUF6325)